MCAYKKESLLQVFAAILKKLNTQVDFGNKDEIIERFENYGLSRLKSRAQLFKTNDVVSERFVKISNVNT